MAPFITFFCVFVYFVLFFIYTSACDVIQFITALYLISMQQPETVLWIPQSHMHVDDSTALPEARNGHCLP